MLFFFIFIIKKIKNILILVFFMVDLVFLCNNTIADKEAKNIFWRQKMKKMLVLILTLFICVGFGFAKDPVEGCWLSYDGGTEPTAGWKIWEENGKLFGTILSLKGYPIDVKAFGTKGKGPYDDFPVKGNMYEMMTVGTPWIYDLTKTSRGCWAYGRIVDPSSGSRYKCKITFHKADGKYYKKDTLEMRGEIGLGIGKSQYWIKATEEEASSLR